MRTVKGLTALAMAIVYLRLPFTAQGGTDAEIQNLLAGEAMEPVLVSLQESADDLAYASNQCQAVLQALLE